MSKLKEWIKEHKKLSIIILIGIVLLIGFLVFFIIVYNQAYHSIFIECGADVAASEFIKSGDANATYVDASTDISKLEPGEYTIKVKSGYFTHKIKVTIEDTTAPIGEAKDVVAMVDSKLLASDFVTNVFDQTNVSITFENEPDFSKVGKSTVNIVLTDTSSNVTTLTANMSVVPFKTSMVVEAGSDLLKASDFSIKGNDYTVETDLEKISTNHVGDNNVSITYNGDTYTCVVSIADTVAPTASFTSVSGYLGVPYKAEDFVSSYNDATNINFSFDKELDYQSTDKQTVTVTLTDEGGNTVSKEVTMTLKEDTEPPVLEGVHDIIVMQGNSVSYKDGVTYTDNCEEGLVFTVDADNVDTDTVGTYPITYTVTDVAGHSVSESCNVIVKERVYDINQINAAADKIIASIITPEMTDRDKAWAIYQWVRSHVAFSEEYIEGSYNKAAYDGVVNWSGDCYVFACTSQTLLTRAGLKNMMINRIPGRRRHYWNLVDVDGTGWYHFDTTPRLDPNRPVFFLWTDEQMWNYSNTHYNCFNYDKEVFTGIN